MGELRVSLYTGERYDKSITVLAPKKQEYLPAIWAFCSDPEFGATVRAIDANAMCSSGAIPKVPFDLAHWQRVAAEKYPHGLPKPHSDDPTQWLFNGHPAGSTQPLSGLFLIISSLIGTLVGVIFVRIVSEFVLITFRINEHLGAIRNRGDIR